MRLIDAEALLDALDDDPPYNWTDSDAEIQAVADWEQFKGMISAQPTASNAEDVIYCQRCSYGMMVDDVLYCTYWSKNTEEYGYCHHGG